jgi:3-isopropylmalate/(R)-2-methylmalate dehydratase large subunit
MQKLTPRGHAKFPAMSTQTLPAATITQKILARAANLDHALPGQLLTANVDLAMMHDSGGPRRVAPMLKRLGAKLFDPDKVVVVSDHYVPAVDADSAQILAFTRGFVAEQGIRHFYDMRGICHVVLPEHGHLRPNMFVVGGDSHSPTGGAFGCVMVGIGATEMAGVLVTGEIWLKVPETIRVALSGHLGTAVSAKDLMLWLCRRLGMDNDYRVIEYQGPALAEFAMEERMTLCNMAAELGAKTGIIGADAVTQSYLAERGVAIDWRTAAQSDPGAHYEQTLRLDLAELVPQVAAPHSPSNADSVTAALGTRIDQAYIGACTGAKINDLRMAAAVLKGQQVASGTRLLIAPASAKTTHEAAADGTLATLTAAGAILLPSGCGACAGLGAGLLASKEVCIASTARNFKGRMGAADSAVFLASPYTVAASAIRGVISDPREFVA